MILHGYTYSVYTRTVHMALLEKPIPFQMREVDPFTTPIDPTLAQLNPFQRVPVLCDGDFTLYETTAILRYLDALKPERPLIPQDPKAAARMQQAMSIMDANGYFPLVRQVFSNAVFNPMFGEPSDPDEIAAGLRAAPAVLGALDGIAAEGLVLTGQTVTLADLHLAPMIGYFSMAPAGRSVLANYPALNAWWQMAQLRPAYQLVCFGPVAN
jgi:glutathione S-transferase